MADDPTIYSERYVAFVDILGFSDIVRNSEHSPHQASALVRVLERIRARSLNGAADDLFGDDLKVQSFSDTIVLSEKVTETGLKWLLYSVEDLTLDLLAQILTRGGIAKGLMYHSEGVAFGPAFLNAYYLESTIAKYPRIVVDRSVHKDYRARNRDRWETGEFAPRLKHADDGPVYLDIFRKFGKLSGPHVASQLMLTGQSCRRTCIQDQLNNSIYNPHHFEKLRWLARYWNSVRFNQPPIDHMEMVDFPNMANHDD